MCVHTVAIHTLYSTWVTESSVLNVNYEKMLLTVIIALYIYNVNSSYSEDYDTQIHMPVIPQVSLTDTVCIIGMLSGDNSWHLTAPSWSEKTNNKTTKT